ncbi:hypothetical protein RND81_10G063500 [Saponaria officinalis]|uniref:Uncharacterized protein n=1 Tax=Saponaria officinalis TaxID=3572 RepID=A0AAW1HZN3_SAPOF
MVGHFLVQSLTTSAVVTSPFIHINHSSSSSLQCLPPTYRKRVVFVKASSSNIDHNERPPSPESKSTLSVILDVPLRIWKCTLCPLGDFGFGMRSIWEGGVGLFLVFGTVLFKLSLAWLKAFRIRSKFRKYSAVFEFPRLRGGCWKCDSVNSLLRSVEAVLEVDDDTSGLLMETMIDITLKDPLPTPSLGPLDAECDKRGREGVCLDAHGIGETNTYTLVKRGIAVVEEAKPLLSKIKAMSEDIQPLLSEVRDSGMLKEVETLTRSLTQATEDLRRVHSSILTPENTEFIQKSINLLIFTLKNIEVCYVEASQYKYFIIVLYSVLAFLGFTGDEATRQNLKLLIESLSWLL